MSESALSVAFFDAQRGIHAAARAGMTLLFEGREARPVTDGAEIEAAGGGWTARAGDALDLSLEAALEPVAMPGATSTVCRARGRAGGHEVDGLALLTETTRAPEWDELDAIRAVSALFDERNALLCLARRPFGAPGHGEELVRAVLITEGDAIDAEDARLSTVYDADGRQRTAGLEIWLPGEEWPRRAFGTAAAGTTLQLEGLVVHSAIFNWRMEGHQGAGAYDMAIRERPPVAA